MTGQHQQNADAQRYQEEMAIGRLNSFLVGTSFLITAYAVVVTAESYSNLARLLWLSHGISSGGFVMAIFFALANYHAARVKYNLQYRVSLWRLPCQFFKDALCLPFGALEDKHQRLSPIHAWLIPMFFPFFWIAMWISFAY